MTNQKRIVLTGATGFLGFRTLERLVEEADVEKVIACGRTLKPGMQVEHPKVEYKLGDLTDINYVLDVAKNANAIIHCAGLSSPWGRAADFEKHNLTSQKNLIQAAEKFGIKRFVFISTPAMYFDYRDRFNIKESDPLPKRLINHYAVTKLAAEKMLENSELEYVSLRPRALTGRGDTVIMPRMIRAYDEGRLKIIGTGKNKVDITPVANVVDAIILGLNAEKKALRQVYNISNGEPVVLWSEIAKLLSRIDKNPPTKKVPHTLVHTVAALMEFLSWLGGLKNEPTFTRYSVGVLAKSITMDISKAEELLGYVPRVSLAEAMEEFAVWHLENEKSKITP